MKQNLQTTQGVISILAIVCLAIGWFNLFSPEVNALLSKRIFYIIVGISFILQAPLLVNKKFVYPMYAAAALCIIGAFLPYESKISGMKTLGLLAGVILSLSNRPNFRQ
jgi:cellulose synthase/poly-beta-1,6-N-acetylglucosamine synthase-like glycosyltransferase